MSDLAKLFTLSQVSQLIAVMPLQPDLITIIYMPSQGHLQPFAMLTFENGEGVLVEGHAQNEMYSWSLPRVSFESALAVLSNTTVIGLGCTGYLVLEALDGRKFEFGKRQISEPVLPPKRQAKRKSTVADSESVLTSLAPLVVPSTDASVQTRARIGQALALSAKNYGGVPKIEYFQNLGMPKITIRLSPTVIVTYVIGISEVWERTVNNDIHSSRKLSALTYDDATVVTYTVEDLWNNQKKGSP